MNETESRAAIWIRHYKWYILIATFFVIFISVMAVQTCHREEYDVSVMYAGPAIVTDTQNAALEATLSKLVKDNDGDGAQEVLFYELNIMTEEELSEAYNKGYSTSAINVSTVREAKDAFQMNVLSDDHFILLLSPERYSVMYENGALEKYADIGITVENTYSEYAVLLKDTELARMYTAFKALPEDTLICFKRISDVNADKKKVLERRSEALEYLKEMIAYKAPDGVILQGMGTAYVKGREQ